MKPLTRFSSQLHQPPLFFFGLGLGRGRPDVRRGQRPPGFGNRLRRRLRRAARRSLQFGCFALGQNRRICRFLFRQAR